MFYCFSQGRTVCHLPVACHSACSYGGEKRGRVKNDVHHAAPLCRCCNSGCVDKCQDLLNNGHRRATVWSAIFCVLDVL